MVNSDLHIWVSNVGLKINPTLSFRLIQEAMNIVKTSPFLTNPRKGGGRHHPPLHPLENRNSAPEIVVTGSPQPGKKLSPFLKMKNFEVEEGSSAFLVLCWS